MKHSKKIDLNQKLPLGQQNNVDKPDYINQSCQATTNKRRKNTKIVASVGVAILAATVFLLLFIQWLMAPKFETNNPIARMILSNGMTIDYEIYADESPRAAGVFVYLAQQGFFDGTIIFDLQYGYVRFGGYNGFKNTSHKENDKNTIDTLKNQINFNKNIPQQWKDKPLSYRVLADNGTIANKYDQQFYLSYIRSTATEFQISGHGGYPPVVFPQLFNSPTEDLSASPNSSIAFAKVYDRQSQDNIKRLSDLKVVDTKNKVQYHLYWQPPVQTIVIKKVSVLNLKGELKSRYSNFNLYQQFFKDSTYWLGADINTTPSIGWSTTSRLLRDN